MSELSRDEASVNLGLEVITPELPNSIDDTLVEYQPAKNEKIELDPIEREELKSYVFQGIGIGASLFVAKALHSIANYTTANTYSTVSDKKYEELQSQAKVYGSFMMTYALPIFIASYVFIRHFANNIFDIKNSDNKIEKHQNIKLVE